MSLGQLPASRHLEAVLCCLILDKCSSNLPLNENFGFDVSSVGLLEIHCLLSSNLSLNSWTVTHYKQIDNDVPHSQLSWPTRRSCWRSRHTGLSSAPAWTYTSTTHRQRTDHPHWAQSRDMTSHDMINTETLRVSSKKPLFVTQIPFDRLQITSY